ncbi:MAG: hypothetical protein II107_03810, partial [Prevotella sp.]|nr:hypothetical protein [Prevotella sp.]
WLFCCADNIAKSTKYNTKTRNKTGEKSELFLQVLLPLPSSREPANAYISAFAGFFHAKNARMDTLYKYRISVAKSSKRPNVREYSNCSRWVHHQKSIIDFREKYGSVPRVEDRDWWRK